MESELHNLTFGKMKYKSVIQAIFQLGLLLLLIPTTNTYGQLCKISDDNARFEKALRPAVKITVDIPMDEVKSGFNDFVKDHFDTNLKGYGLLARKDEVHTEFEDMPLLAQNAIRLIGSFTESGDETHLYLLAQWEDESFVTPSEDPDEYQNLRRAAIDFTQNFVPTYYAELVEDSNKAYEKASNDLEKKKAELEKNEDDLRKLKQEIIELENEIRENKVEIETLRESRDDQKMKVAEIKEKADLAKKAVADLN